MKRNYIVVFVIIFIIALVIGAMLRNGKKNEGNKQLDTKLVNNLDEQKEEGDKPVKTEEIDYSKMGNNQGNSENGVSQVYVTGDRVLLSNIMDDRNNRLLYFATKNQKLQIACDKINCLHNDSKCLSNSNLYYPLGYSSVYFGIPSNYRNEIWKYENGTLSSLYRSTDQIGGLWGYGGYLYYVTAFHVYRLSIKNFDKADQVFEEPVLAGFMTFHGDKIYYCKEDKFIYRANLDGSQIERISDEKALSPQIYNNRLYYRGVEYDKNGTFNEKNTLCSTSLDGKNKKTLLKQVYQFNLMSDGIYYITLPDKDGVSTLCYIDYEGKNQRKIVECGAFQWGVFEESDWILFNKPEGELPPGEEGGKPLHLYCIKKDGTQEKRLDYPQTIEE